MFYVKYLFYFILLQLIVATPQINLYYTDGGNESNNALQHDCLHIAASFEQANATRQIMSYCMGELLSEFEIEKEDFFPNFTFDELSKQNISSQQLYFWSAPIDLIENYQFYLNQLSTSNDSFLSEEIFYNCTMPRFGSMCQYELQYHHPNHSSLYQIIHNFYYTYGYIAGNNFTCYTHLQCNRGPFPSCLDWTEICDGNIDCIGNEIDEEYCWQLDINKCKDNEYQCINGQCIPQSFYQDDKNVPDCLDRSDELGSAESHISEPSFEWEDSTCENTRLTSSCVGQRTELLIQAIFSEKDNSISYICWSTFQCMLAKYHPTCRGSCRDEDVCVEIIESQCPDMFYIPAVPVLFGHIYFAYQKNDVRLLTNYRYVFPYVCYNNSFYDDYFINASKILFNNTMCYRINKTLNSYDGGSSSWHSRYLAFFYRNLWEYHQIRKYNQTLNHISAKCNRSNMYQCNYSLRCIPTRRTLDIIVDCPYEDDLTEYKKIIREETLMGIKMGDQSIDGITGLRFLINHISFQTICDGFTELLPQIIHERNQTDETECEQWPCNNIYTRCDNIWNCLNGADELGCNVSLPLNCSSNDHICVSPHTNQFMCLPINQANDGKVDCIGATDEPTLCRRATYQTHEDSLFHCMVKNISSCTDISHLCNGLRECIDKGDDEQFCEKRPMAPLQSICIAKRSPPASDVEKFLCSSVKVKSKQPIKYFTLDEMVKSGDVLRDSKADKVFPSLPIIEWSGLYQPRCHRGLDLRVWLNNKNNLTIKTCLCPPSFYGDQCQYQNQRISLSIKFRAFSDSWQTLFAIIISLIDDSDEKIIHSYEQFTYLSTRDCKIKFNLYLLYSTRPKDSTKNYSIHIDIYEKELLTHRGSLLFPITFPFLPVHRLAFIIDIPQSDNSKTQICSNNECINGKCIRYLNNPGNQTFCQCDEGWSGRYCTIKHSCMCSSDSLCLGVSANNRSICVCPMNKFGPRCLLIDTICQTNDNLTCENGGSCVPIDDYMVLKQKFVCICPKRFSGDRCQFADNKLILSFSKSIVLSQSISIHFIEVINKSIPRRESTLKAISVKKDSVDIYWSRPFHLVFIEFFNKTYYLIVVQTIYNRSTTITKMINPSDHCPHISEVLNETIVEWPLLRRIKYYHLPCQKYSPDLQCFYDDIHFCLCYNHSGKRLPNCFEFEHNMTFNCLDQSVCENGAQCLQDSPDCPSRSICVCPLCFYGKKCHFSTNGFGLSLDAILGYHILPNVSLAHQPSIVQFSLTLTILFTVAGLINGIFSIITFKNKIVLKVGCGLYLLGASITTLLTMMMFGLKFLILLLTQMAIISNRLFLLFQCHSMDFVLRVGLCMDQWLNACVALERAMTASKGPSFDKKKSKITAKLVIVILLIVIIGTYVDDPIYRRLIDEENDDDIDDQKRIWCIVTYPSSLELYNYIKPIFHLFGPFMINLISAVILIVKKSDQEANIHKKLSYRVILREQFRQHKNLFIAPIVLVILAIPRVIIIFVSKCMKSTNDSWLYLIGYFISFIPPMLTFIIFVLPSKFYRKELRKTLAYYRAHIQRRLHLIS